jgi:Ca-activated chloride channel family protein
MSFHQPSAWFLLLLLLLPVLWMRWRSPRRRAAVNYSATRPLRFIGPSIMARLRWIIPALRLAAIAILIIAIARPRKGDEQTRVNTEGIAIQLIVDRSGSMRAQDFKINDRPTDRLAVVKKVVQEFVTGGRNLAGRPNDMIGCIAFGTFADSVCPITTDHPHLVEAIKQIKVATEQQEAATAIGEAIALGVERLRALEQRIGQGADRTIKGKIMILLTDGENNAGDIDPMVAAQMAAAFGIKVYTIGAGTTAGMAPVPGTDIFGRPMQIPVSIDEDSLRAIATATGGKYFRASDTESLQQIYAQIDALERTEIHEKRYVTYKEAAVESVRIGAVTLPPLLIVVMVLLLAETLLSTTRFRSTP